MAQWANQQYGEYLVLTLVTSEVLRENCYIVVSEASREMAVIDPGGEAAAITEVVQQQGGQLGYILLTHAHHDHVGAVNALRQRFQAPCFLHVQDARLLRQAPVYALRFSRERMEPVDGVGTFEEPLKLEYGQGLIRSIHTPGHTKGGVCYVFPGFVFTGDTVLYERVGRHDLPGGDCGEIEHSIARLLESLPDESVLLPGHGRPWTAAEARVWRRTERLHRRTGRECQSVEPDRI